MPSNNWMKSSPESGGSVSKPCPSPDQILQSLDRLRALAGEVATRHSQNIVGARERDRLAQRRAEASAKATEEQLKASLAQAQRNLEEAVTNAHARARHRATLIRQAQVTLRKAAAQRADAEEGKRKFEIQREMLRATRKRDAGLAAAKSTFDEFSASLAAHETNLLTLEQQAHHLLGVLGRNLNHRLAQAHETARPDLFPTEEMLAQSLASTLESTRSDLVHFGKLFLPALSRAWPITLILVLSPVAVIPVLQHFRVTFPSAPQLAGAAAGLALLGLFLHVLGRHLALPAAERIIQKIGQARVLLHASRELSAETFRDSKARFEAEFEEVSRKSHEAWSDLAHWLEENRGALPAQVDARANRAIARNQLNLQHRLEQLQALHTSDSDQLQARIQERLANARREADQTRESSAQEQAHAIRDLEADWTRNAVPLLETLDSLRDPTATPMADRLPDPPGSWVPPSSFSPAVRFGSLTAHLDHILEALPPDALPTAKPSGHWSLPLLLQFPKEGSLLIETDASQRGLALGTLNHVVYRLLANSPPGRISFTVFDPVGLGQSFASLTHLADEADHLIHGRIWTQSSQLEERLGDLNDHLEKVIQMYLRNEYPTIAEYNEQAGNIAEKYRFLVLADFPAGFTDLALRRLQSIATTGARCGVFLLAHRDLSRTLPADFPTQAFRQSALRLTLPAATSPHPALLNDRSVPGTTLRLDPPASTESVTAFIHQVARAHRDSNRVEVPFAHIAPDPTEFWSIDTAAELRVPIGRTGATKLQYLALGKATRQHALIAGKTGSGKSTLFHVLITNLALWCRPDQVEFYLVDFKKGVEFKCYATHRLPHARVVAIESDRDFGLSVLQRLDEELRRRGELFRDAEVQDIASYRRSPDSLPMPRVLLLIDEFQEFFVEEDRIAQNASVLLDRIVRQGRAFGIHVILGSQTLGGAYTVARSTLGQMAVRIALQCNEADALLIMDEENPAPRLLSRPGEAIYNDAAGARTGNSPFQIVWLPDDVRDAHLRRVRDQADHLSPPAGVPLVFEGDAPADVRDNPLLRQTLRTAATRPPTMVRTWLGAPNSIKGPTEVAFARRSTDNLLVVGQRDDALLGIVGVALAALASQYPAGGAEFTILDGSAPDAPDHDYLQRIASALHHPVTITRPGDTAAVIQRLANELQTRTATTLAANAPARFLMVHGLQQFRALRQEDEFAFDSSNAAPHPGALFKQLIAEGPPHGIHVLVGCDTHANAVRFLGRKGLAEFGYRVLFQMSANDSASLIDNPMASRLGLHRALLYQDREGYLEVFRPYALPETAWLRPHGIVASPS
jgi:S-DNA-T family DNA segregation ATPase FtsK/SpoIIIE